MKRLLVLMLGLCFASSAFAQNNDFLSDYSLLESFGGKFVSHRYYDPNLVQRMADYTSVLVDQPEIFIAADSKYKGAKGDQLKALADVARLSTIERLEAGGFTIATEPGPNVLYMRWAITDLYLQKKKRGLLSYTPIGMVVHATKSAAVRDLWKKIDITELSMEIEFSDLVTGEILGAAITARQGLRKAKGQKAEVVSWQALDALFETVGERLACVLSNARVPESEWATCADIWIEPEVPE
ncbi:MAG: DUF3313 domain-containing protein [Woeseiaceae bacterium]